MLFPCNCQLIFLFKKLHNNFPDPHLGLQFYEIITYILVTDTTSMVNSSITPQTSILEFNKSCKSWHLLCFTKPSLLFYSTNFIIIFIK